MFLDPPSPDVQRETTNFLSMGHAKDCWCSDSNNKGQGTSTTPFSSIANERRAEAALEVTSSNPHTPISTTSPVTAYVVGSSFESKNDNDSNFSDNEVVLVTPSTEGGSTRFGDLDVIEGMTIDSDDEDWSLLSACVPAQQRSASLESWTTLKAFDHPLNAPTVDEPALGHPSPPVSSARVSDDEGEAEWFHLSLWDEPPALSLDKAQAVEDARKEVWSAKVEADVIGANAVEWPTVQGAMKARDETSWEGEDAWGGKVWDGVTDWY